MLLFARHVAAQKDDVGGYQRSADVQGADPECSQDGRPVGGRPEEAMPGVELCAEEVRPNALRSREDAEHLATFAL